jgi:hypothetical protein
MTTVVAGASEEVGFLCALCTVGVAGDGVVPCVAVYGAVSVGARAAPWALDGSVPQGAVHAPGSCRGATGDPAVLAWEVRGAVWVCAPLP